MPIDTAALRRKGSPPTREIVPNALAADPRPTDLKNRTLQLMVPPDVFLAFSARAGHDFGYLKGAKSKLFLAMWDAYNSGSQ